MGKPHERIFVALDTPDADAARSLARDLQGLVGGFKIGLELFISTGPKLVEEIRRYDQQVFLDLKLHDIPNTVAGAARSIGRLGVQMFTVHANGGVEMMRRANAAAREGADEAGHPAPMTLAVTVLTSHDDDDLQELGWDGPCETAVGRLAGLADRAQVGGVVCSPLEVRALRERFPDQKRVVPGIRLPGGSTDDQARVATPGTAIADGADYLVIGRPIRNADDPAAAAQAIADEIARTS
ncbi:MAG: orotidine-5'-phosphate decarboxylase [Acidobacteriota bacterium]|nr:orotidine-5'-phosphate decarboxylase [Acidobacteriota bacterium]MDH3786729.1 orotidine-5'-phosphate decarboxylase [Acidobacteriota bacterium]